MVLVILIYYIKIVIYTYRKVVAMMDAKIELVFLQGENVVLRPFTNDDVPIFTKWFNDPEIRPFLNGYLPVTEDDEKGFLENIRKNSTNIIFFVIIVKQKVIGLMSLNSINWKDRTAISAAVIGEKEYWGKGYGTEAKMLLLDYAFNTLNLHKIRSLVIAYNKRSYSYSMKCGYKVEGRLKQQVFKNGKYQDEILLAVFKKDWQLAQKEWQKKKAK